MAVIAAVIFAGPVRNTKRLPSSDVLVHPLPYHVLRDRVNDTGCLVGTAGGVERVGSVRSIDGVGSIGRRLGMVRLILRPIGARSCDVIVRQRRKAGAVRLLSGRERQCLFCATLPLAS